MVFWNTEFDTLALILCKSKLAKNDRFSLGTASIIGTASLAYIVASLFNDFTRVHVRIKN